MILRGLFATAVTAAMTMSLPAFADDGSALLASLAGNWNGRGSAKLPGREKAERVTCRIATNWDAAARTLAVAGVCATTQAKNNVRGSLKLEGGSVSGSFLGNFDGATATRSTGSVSGSELVVQTSFVNDATGALSQTRQVIRRGGGGFTSDFYLFDSRSGQFEKSGSMTFTGS
jgi:hypothetical protein